MTSSESHAGEASVGTPDWRRDLDILDARYVTDPAPIWSQLRGGQCPVAFSERYGRSWMPVNFDDVAEIAGDPATFSSLKELEYAVPESWRSARWPVQ